MTTESLSGTLASEGNITASIAEIGSVSGGLSMFAGDYQPYTGEYTVNPDFDGRTLDTANKYMSDNLVVEPIQVESVSNLGGGKTIYIGGII